MAGTTADLVKAALERLGALGVGQAVAAEDSTLVTARATKLLATLRATRVVSIPNPGNIDDELFIPLAWLLAAVVAQEYGLPNADELVQRYTGELANIARRTTPSGLAAQVLDQLAIWGENNHTVDRAAVERAMLDGVRELAARGVIYVASVDDVPEEAVAAFAEYVAAGLAPATYQTVRAEAEARLGRIARMGGHVPDVRKIRYF